MDKIHNWLDDYIAPKEYHLSTIEIYDKIPICTNYGFLKINPIWKVEVKNSPV